MRIIDYAFCLAANVLFGVLFISCSSQPTNPDAVGPQPVDLGLSVKWASCNLGASKPTDFGDYYAWGEVETHYFPGHYSQDSPSWRTGKMGYSWKNYKYANKDQNKLIKYCPENKQKNYWDGVGNADGKTDLREYDYNDDAARQLLGERWHIPTEDEWLELKDKCEWVWKTPEDGYPCSGYLITGSNRNSIFLPVAGEWVDASFEIKNVLGGDPCGEYWTSSIDLDMPNLASTFHVGYDRPDLPPKHGIGGIEQRCNGLPIRPVMK